MQINEKIAPKVAEYLLQIKAIKLSSQSPFKWSSGLWSPIYCDNRVILSYPSIRTFIRQCFVEIIHQYYKAVDVIAGVATGGIAHGVLVAQELNLPFVYVRPEPKKHGLSNAIEGYIEKGQSVLVIEDLISTGGSSIKVIEHLQDAECVVKGMISIFTYNLKVAEDNLSKYNLNVMSLSDYPTLLQIALDRQYISALEYSQLKEWYKNPQNWSNKYERKQQ